MGELKRNYHLSCYKNLPGILPDDRLANHVNFAAGYINELEEQNKEMLEILVEINEYLTPNRLNSIYCDSILHRKVNRVIEKHMEGNMDTITTKEENGRKYNQYGDEIIVCRICEDTGTISIGDKLCDRCWELESRIHNNIKVARKIIANVDNVNKFT